ncbi:MAG: tetratricopeptide repeat protein [Kiritimatiellae bacterium]|nr:tetratricopeptide repeat protein [Kiritimatiellia bacterium]
MKPTAPRWQKHTVARAMLALLSPVLFFMFIEALLRLWGFGQATSYLVRGPDRRHYVPNQRFTIPFLGPYLSRPVVPAVLARHKPPSTCRIFVLGESAARGEPNPAFSFSRILEVMLRETHPGVNFEVINTGITAINSHIIRKIARDCRHFDPDVYVVFMGNNEFIGPYSAVAARNGRLPRLSLTRMGIAVQSTRVGQFLTAVVSTITGAHKRARREWGGMSMFVQNRVPAGDPRLAQVYSNFRANLETICTEAQRAGITVVLSTIPTNLRDCPPFASVHRPDLPPEKIAAWETHWKRALRCSDEGKNNEAIEAFLAARGIDDGYAELHFRLGQCLLAVGQTNEAREAFILARDLDALRFRADSRINQIIRETAARRSSGDKVILADPEREMALPAEARGIPGAESFYEHVHFTFVGNYAVATVIFSAVRKALPLWVRERAQFGGSVPGPERCAEHVAYSLFSRCAALNDILGITSHPPFPPEKAERDRAALRKLEAGLTPQALEQMADHAQALFRERPEDLLLATECAALEMFRGRFDVAAHYYRSLLARCPDTTARYWLGRALIAQGRYDEALPEFRAVLRDAPGHLEAMAGLAAILHRKGELKRAVRLYRLFLELRPNDPDVTHALEAALRKKRR